MAKVVAEKNYTFEEFEIDVSRRILLKNGEAVPLKSKAFDLLLTLVARHGEVLSKNELLDTVWENQFVEENNLTVHISALRKIFGETKNEHRFIVTVPGKGYFFAAQVFEVGNEKEPEAVGNRLSAKSSGRRREDNEQNSLSLIGREREIAEIKNLLRGEARLITLTGAGGTGKTRLAQAVSEESTSDFPDGVFFIELASVSNPELIVSLIANALGVKEAGDKSLIDALKIFLRERRILLVLDNFEQLSSAAHYVEELLTATQFLKVLVTSRIVLRLKIENELVITPLAVPPRDAVLSIKQLNEYSAIALFDARANAVKPGFTFTKDIADAVAEICRKLDGLPLAIELAAARIKLLSPQAIFERLEHSLNLLTGGDKNLPSRQRTMRGTIQWSYELLAENERILFRRLAVFAGGFSVQAAESVIGQQKVAGGETINNNGDQLTADFDVLDLLTSLVDNNLLTLTEQHDGSMRLRMLRVVREFAAECLEASGEAKILRHNHALFFLALTEEAEPHLSDEQSVEWLEKLESEKDNLRSTLHWSLDNDTEILTRIVVALRYFWLDRGYLFEGREWFETAYEQCRDTDSPIRFKLLNGIGLFMRYLGNFDEAEKYYEKCRIESKATGELIDFAVALGGLAVVALAQNDFTKAQKFSEEYLIISRQTNNELGIANSLCSLGNITQTKGDFSAARKFIKESLAISGKIGNKHLTCVNLNNLGAVAYGEKKYAEAQKHFTDALKISTEANNIALATASIDGCAAAAQSNGDFQRAAQLAGAAESLRESVGYEAEISLHLFRNDYLSKVQNALDEKTLNAAYQKGQTLDLDEAVALAENSFSVGRNNEIIIETHKFERVIVEEEIEDVSNEYEVKQINSANTNTGFSDWLRKYVVLLIGATLAVIIGGYFLFGGRSGLAPAIPFANSSVKQLTTSGKVGLAALSPDGKLFAYTIDDLGQKSLWLGFVNGGNHLPLRPAADAVYRTLAFSPDSTTLYFSVRDEQNPKGAMYKMPVSGGVPVKILDEIDNFVLSPDGRQVAIGRRDDQIKRNFLVVAALDGSQRRDAASFPKEFSFFFDTISWSADGKRFAVSAVKDSKIYQHEIAVVKAATGEIERISPPILREITKTVWLADNSGLIVTAVEHDSHSSVPQYLIYHVAYPSGETSAITADRSNYGASWHNDAGVSLDLSAKGDLLLAVEHRQLSNIWVAPTDNLSSARQITFSSFGKYDGLWGMDWTTDGRLIYTTSDTRSQYLEKINADGSDRQSLTAPGNVDSVLTVSNDGRYVLFHSNRGGDYDIWRIDTDGANLKQLTFGGKGFIPAPSPDGRWVYFKSYLKNVGELCRVPIDGGEPECLNDKSTSWGSFSPDGKFFAASLYTDKTRLAIFSADTSLLIKQFDLPKGGTLYMGSRWSPDSLAVVYRDSNFGYWKQPIEGGEPQRLEGLPNERFYNFAFSKDGRQFAFVRGTEIRDVVLMTNR